MARWMPPRGVGIFIAALLAVVCSGTPRAEDTAELPVIFADETISASGKALLRRHARRIAEWANAGALGEAVAAQNRQKRTLEKIRQIDATWTAGGELEGLDRELLENACAKALDSFMTATTGFKEGFVMDDLGALVCMTQRTSDYWQGDEAKWQRSFDEGRGAVYVGAPTWDKSADSMLVQISAPIMRNGRAVGALTVGKTVSSELGSRPAGTQ
jgi:hypothetical protein